MINWNELRITQDGKYLIIDASIAETYCANNVQIDSVVIDTQDTYVTTGPSDKPVYTYSLGDSVDLTYALPEQCNCNPVLEDEDKSYCFTYGEGNKGVRLKLSKEDLGIPLDDNMFFVYIIPSGDITYPYEAVPYIMGTVTNLFPIYQNLMKGVKEIEKKCDIPKCFIDGMLRLKALELCIRTNNYPQAIKYWNKFFKNKLGTNRVTNCSCYA